MVRSGTVESNIVTRQVDLGSSQERVETVVMYVMISTTLNVGAIHCSRKKATILITGNQV